MEQQEPISAEMARFHAAIELVKQRVADANRSGDRRVRLFHRILLHFQMDPSAHPFNAWNRASYSAGHFNAALNQLRDGIIEEDPDLTAYSEYLERIAEQMQ